MSNQAAWIAEKGARLNVDKAPFPKNEPGQIILKTGAVAINPIDWKMQDWGLYVQTWPTIFGSDAAGEVVEVGEGVTHFKKGDRVLSHCIGLMTGNTSEDAFQAYISVNPALVAKIPDSMSFEEAAVLPLSLSTASAGLFQEEFLGLPHPKVNPTSSDSAVLIWGGSSSVGSSAIQLANAAGVKVMTTASKRNLEYVKSLGAAEAYDYNSPTIVDDLIKVLKGVKFIGAFNIIGSPETTKMCAEVVSQLGGGKVASTLAFQGELPDGVWTKQVYAPSILHNEVSKAVYGEYVSEALKKGTLMAKPDPDVIGKGLDHMQTGFDKLRKGVSASKIVISI